ncbi:hypothetical protein C8R44DRAFT_895534 [Mycena epipterygia]|nr:hypothetical protein C8R44DRAFT_895534 [Mycena epipterygia]
MRTVQHWPPSASTHEHPYPTTHDYAPDSPTTAASVASEAESPASPNFVLPLHVAWHARAYPANHGDGASFHSGIYVGEREDGEEVHDDGEAQWSPASDAHSISMEAMPAHAHDTPRGRALV